MDGEGHLEETTELKEEDDGVAVGVGAKDNWKPAKGQKGSGRCRMSLHKGEAGSPQCRRATVRKPQRRRGRGGRSQSAGDGERRQSRGRRAMCH